MAIIAIKFWCGTQGSCLKTYEWILINLEFFVLFLGGGPLKKRMKSFLFY